MGPAILDGGPYVIADRTLQFDGATAWSQSGLDASPSPGGGGILNAGTLGALSDRGIVPGVDGGAIQNSGIFEKTGATGTTSIGVPFTNTGTVRAASGTLSFEDFSQTAGSLVLMGGTLAFPNGLSMQDGSLEGTGTVAGNVILSGGALSPGASSGQIDIGGNFTLHPQRSSRCNLAALLGE